MKIDLIDLTVRPRRRLFRLRREGSELGFRPPFSVKLTGIGQARPTYGMHRAVEAVGEWVASLHDGARVLARSIAP